MNRWQLEQKIVLKALKDPEFKKKLLSQPQATVREFLKSEKVVDLSGFDKINIRVVEEKKAEWVLALPWLEKGTGSVMDMDLENVSGGIGGFSAGKCGTYGGCGG